MIATHSETSPEALGYRQELKRSLGFPDLVLYALMYMVPIAPFAVFGYVSDASKGMVALAYLIGMCAMALTAMSYVVMSSAYPLAGSVYSYARLTLGEFAGFLGGWVILLDYVLVPALVCIFAMISLRAYFPGLPAYPIVAGFVIASTALNVLGIKVTARTNLIMMCFCGAVLVVFLAWGAALLLAGDQAARFTLKPLYNPEVFSLNAVLGAISIAALSFLGFDAVTTLAEETKSRRSRAGLAGLVALFIAGALFVAQTWIAQDLSQGVSVANADMAFYDVIRARGADWLHLLAIASIVLVSFTNALLAQVAAARLLFSMARDRRLPRPLAYVTKRTGNPVFGTATIGLLSLGVGYVFQDRGEELIRIVNFGAISAFVLLHVTVMYAYATKRIAGGALTNVVCPILGVVVLAKILWEMNISALFVGGIWVAIGSLCYLGSRQFSRPA